MMTLLCGELLCVIAICCLAMLRALDNSFLYRVATDIAILCMVLLAVVGVYIYRFNGGAL